jgi:aminoglycoside phosphotransferase (APT) family kinase protein
VQDIASVEQVLIGADTLIWRVEHEGMVSALRVFREEQLGTSRREIAAMRAASVAGIPVPEIRAQTLWHGRPVLLLSWCPGVMLLDAFEQYPWRIWSLSVSFGRMHARLHRAAAGSELSHGAHSWIELVGPDERALQDQLRRLPLRTDALLHLDYHPLNVLTDGRKITAVLDWANAEVGDPRADIARTVTLLRLYPGGRGLRLPFTILSRCLVSLGYSFGYRQEAGPVGNLASFYAWNGAFMIRDLLPRLGKPDSELLPKDFDRMRRWTERWKKRMERSGARGQSEP